MMQAQFAASLQASAAAYNVRPRTARQARAAVQVTCAAWDRQSQLLEQVQEAVKKCAVGVAAAALLAAAPGVMPEVAAPAAQASLTAADPVKNAGALLRNALPVDCKPIRRVQGELEGISETLRIPGSKALPQARPPGRGAAGLVAKAVRAASSVLERDGATIEAALAPAKKAEGQAALGKLHQGRATVDLKVKYTSAREDNSTGGVMRIVADGYNAPLSAGNFVDLVSRGFYNGERLSSPLLPPLLPPSFGRAQKSGHLRRPSHLPLVARSMCMEIQRADGFVVQTGKPADAEGFVVRGEVRRIPFEVMVRGDKVPVYEETLQDNGRRAGAAGWRCAQAGAAQGSARFNEIPVLPFNAYGTMALARSEFAANDASSQFFWLLKASGIDA
eukprot:scaffold9.g3252.t1